MEQTKQQNGGLESRQFSLSALLWAAYLFRVDGLVVAAAVILAASAFVGVRRAPLVLLGRALFGWIAPGRTEYLDQRGMRFAHALGAVFAGVTAALLFLAPGAGRVALLLLCLLKTSAALGACSALKLYQCVTSESCCGFLRRDTTRTP